MKPELVCRPTLHAPDRPNAANSKATLSSFGARASLVARWSAGDAYTLGGKLPGEYQ